jgi:hypothetical protein
MEWPGISTITLRPPAWYPRWACYAASRDFLLEASDYRPDLFNPPAATKAAA